MHRRQLLDQWVERLNVFLNLSKEQIGVIGGGKRKPTNSVDVAVMQSLIKKNIVDDIVANYGHVIVDECHHLSLCSPHYLKNSVFFIYSMLSFLTDIVFL